MEKEMKQWKFGIYFFAFGALINATVVLYMILSGTGPIMVNLILFFVFSGLTILCVNKRKKLAKLYGYSKSNQIEMCDFCNKRGIISREFTFFSCKTFFEGTSTSSNVIKRFYRHEDFKNHHYQMCKRCIRKETFIPLVIFLFVFCLTMVVSLMVGLQGNDLFTLGAFILFLGLVSTAVISSSSIRNKPQKKALRERKREEMKVSGKKDYKISILTPDEHQKLDDSDKSKEGLRY